jgi:hypothetical protein
MADQSSLETINLSIKHMRQLELHEKKAFTNLSTSMLYKEYI